MVHIGSKIKDQFDATGRTIAWFAREIQCERTNVYDIFERSHIDTDLLLKISEELNFDFFIYYKPKLKP